MTDERVCRVLDCKFVRGHEPAGSKFLRLDGIQRRTRPYFRLVATVERSRTSRCNAGLATFAALRPGHRDRWGCR
jgi:hypothetical protein